MNKSQISMLLGTAAAYDRRTIGEADVEAWAAAIGGLDYEDARQAVIDHYGSSGEWLKPAHVRSGVHRIRADRLANADRMLPPADPDARDYRDQLRAHIKAIGDGRRVGFALEPGERLTSAPTEEYAAARGQGYARRRAALSVPCPVAGCRMAQGRPCRIIGSRRPAPAGYHQPRLEAALQALTADDDPGDVPSSAPDAVSSLPWCGRCHEQSRTRTTLTSAGELRRVECPTCGPAASASGHGQEAAS